VGRYGGARQGTGDNIKRRMRFAFWRAKAMRDGRPEHLLGTQACSTTIYETSAN
jgi:hypothetical protein